MTREQIIAIKSSQRRLGLADEHYRLILRNVGEVDTCKALSNEGFERVMAFFEEHGQKFNWPIQLAESPTYWRDKLQSGGGRMAHKIHALATELAELEAADPGGGRRHYELSGLVARASQGRTTSPEALTPRQAWTLIETLKSIRDRGNRSTDSTDSHRLKPQKESVKSAQSVDSRPPVVVTDTDLVPPMDLEDIPF